MANIKVIKRIICDIFEPLGFKNNGKYFNKLTDDNLIQVIAINQFKVIDNGHRAICVDLAVYLPEFAQQTFQPTIDLNKIYMDADCDIRTSIGHLQGIWKYKNCNDFYYDLDELSENQIIENIKQVCDSYVFKFFEDFTTRKQILHNLLIYEKDRKIWANNSMIQCAMIHGYQGDMKKAEDLFNQYYIKQTHAGHKSYIQRFAHTAGIKL